MIICTIAQTKKLPRYTNHGQWWGPPNHCPWLPRRHPNHGQWWWPPYEHPSKIGNDIQIRDLDAQNWDPHQYWSLVGALQYLTITRLDFFYAVNKLYHYMQVPTSDHWTFLKWVLRYVKGIVDYRLHIVKSNPTLKIFIVSHIEIGQVVWMIGNQQVAILFF